MSSPGKGRVVDVSRNSTENAMFGEVRVYGVQAVEVCDCRPCPVDWQLLCSNDGCCRWKKELWWCEVDSIAMQAGCESGVFEAWGKIRDLVLLRGRFKRRGKTIVRYGA